MVVGNAYNSNNNPMKQFNKLPNVKPALIKNPMTGKHAMSLNQIPQSTPGNDSSMQIYKIQNLQGMPTQQNSNMMSSPNIQNGGGHGE